MSTTNEICKDIKIPPGAKINSTEIKFIPLVNSTSPFQVTFPLPRPTTPLPPLVQATFLPVNGDGFVEVTAIIFIDAQANIKNVSVYWNNDNAYPKFNIAYDSAEVKSKTFNAYQVSFSVTVPVKPTLIETIVWDEDPKASRGTITTVQP